MAEEHLMPYQRLWEIQFQLRSKTQSRAFLLNQVLSLSHSKAQQIPFELFLAPHLKRNFRNLSV